MSSGVKMGNHGMSPLFTFPLQWLFSVSVVVETHPLLSVPVSDSVLAFSLADIMRI